MESNDYYISAKKEELYQEVVRDFAKAFARYIEQEILSESNKGYFYNSANIYKR
jgi:AcrR family transcriptional regulator